LIESSAAGAGGEAKMLIGSDGVQWTIALPIAVNPSAVLAAPRRLVFEALSAGHNSAYLDGRVGLKRLEGKRILVVEDEPLLAMDIAGLLEDAGACVIGPVGNVPAALSLIEQYRIHGALLDANLVGNPIDDIAAALVHNNIPFVFLSGYNRASLPKAFDAVELLSKPFDANMLLAAAAKLVA
jgi:CheY-like chemotaxis protein